MMRLNRSHLRNLQKAKRRKTRGKVVKLKPRAGTGIQVRQKRRLETKVMLGCRLPTSSLNPWTWFGQNAGATPGTQ